MDDGVVHFPGKVLDVWAASRVIEHLDQGRACHYIVAYGLVAELNRIPQGLVQLRQVLQLLLRFVINENVLSTSN